MKKLIFFALGVGMIAIASSCNKYDFSEGELSTVSVTFRQVDNYALPTSITWEESYVDSLDTVSFSNGNLDTIKMRVYNPYNIPFSFSHDVFAQNFGTTAVYDQSFVMLDKNNLTNDGDTLNLIVDCGALSIGESKTLDIKLMHKDYLIRTCHYTASRQY